MCIDRFHHSLHEYVVVAFHLQFFHLIYLILLSGILSFYSSEVVNEIVYPYLQFLDTERLAKEGVSSAFQSFESVSHLCL